MASGLQQPQNQQQQLQQAALHGLALQLAQQKFPAEAASAIAGVVLLMHCQFHKQLQLLVVVHASPALMLRWV
jgi:hypothetical protein